MSNKIVTQDEWLKARQAFLKEEKEFTRKRDELSKKDRDYPGLR